MAPCKEFYIAGNARFLLQTSRITANYNIWTKDSKFFVSQIDFTHKEAYAGGKSGPRRNYLGMLNPDNLTLRLTKKSVLQHGDPLLDELERHLENVQRGVIEHGTSVLVDAKCCKCLNYCGPSSREGFCSSCSPPISYDVTVAFEQLAQGIFQRVKNPVDPSDIDWLRFSDSDIDELLNLLPSDLCILNDTRVLRSDQQPGFNIYTDSTYDTQFVARFIQEAPKVIEQLRRRIRQLEDEF